MSRHNELEMRAGDFGWIVSSDALRPEVTTLRDITAALRREAREPTATWPLTPTLSPSMKSTGRERFGVPSPRLRGEG